ncbi:MAG: response regulator, partial [Bacteroidia bacterium]|nr:response regulator [Bacteroidia bacterium]
NGKLEDVYFNFVYQPYLEADETISGITIIAYEVTGQVIVKKALEAQYEAEKIAVRKIKVSEERFRQLVLQAPVAICVMLGENFLIKTINQKMADVWGRTIVEAINKPVFELLPEVSTQGYKELLESVYKTGERYVSEESLVNFNRNGKLENVFVKFVYEPFINAEGAVSGVMCLGHEITEQVNERKKIEKNEQRFQGAIAAVQGILWTNSASGEMIGEQLAWASLTGQSYEEYQGFGWASAIHPDDAQPTIDAWNEAVSEGKNFIFEHRVRLKNGNWGIFSVRAIPSLDSEGAIQEWIGVHTDITEQRQTENALKSAFHQLEEAKSKAEAAAQIAEDAVKAKQQFLSNMSHEIRTPMNSIIGFTNVVLKTDLNTKQKEYINAIKVSGDALLVLINDILDLAKVDAGKMTFEQIPFNLITSISSMIQVFENKLQEKNLNLVSEYDLSIPEVLEGDPMRLRQIILNLISNAVKFSAKGKITLSVSLLKEDIENVTLEFAVKDTGIGICEDKIDHVFDNFRQVADDNTRLYGGTGLGLAIVKQLVESQGGSVNVQSKIDIGSTFSFILSFKKTTTTTPLAVTSSLTTSPLSIKNVKVLIVEDIALNQLLMKTILIDFGFEFDFANNGKIAIEKLKNDTYDIILMDLQMPEMNGFEATEYIRNVMKSQIPIIALTADVTSVDVEKCKAFGMNDYISKPIDEKLLYIKIVKYLNV